VRGEGGGAEERQNGKGRRRKKKRHPGRAGRRGSREGESVPRYVDPKDRAPETTINLFIPLAAADVHFCGDLHSPCPARKPRLFFVSSLSAPPSRPPPPVCLSVWLAGSLISSFFP